jgi:alkylation response protein AidB-like acyl-CoA dehydrogenase
MDLTWSDDEEAFRLDARAWLERNLAEWHDEVGGEPASGDTRDGFAQHLLWERRLFADRWAVVSWAPEHGGRGASLWQWLLFEEEYYRAGGPQRITQNGIFLLAPSIYEFGTPAQQDGILPRMAGAEDLWCQGWSEPNAGSDLASVSSRARRVDGGWVLDGQKTWTTRGGFCTHLFGLFRTDPASQRHKGLTYLLVPLDTPGVTVRGFGRLDGDEGFAEVFFEDAFLADDAVPGGVVLGEAEGGWGVAMATAGSERGLTLRSPGRFLATAGRLVDEYRRREGARAADPLLRRRIADAWMKAEAYQLQTLQTVTRLAAGEKAGAEASLTKLWWSELDVELHAVALDLLGPEAELEGPWSKGWQFSLSGPIYAGTNEIQRNIAAERLLGLPRGAR